MQNIIKIKNTFPILLAALCACVDSAKSDPKPFITTWETTGSNESITIPTVSGETYYYTVNWGDGSTDNTIHTKEASHIYTEPGTYTVTISGTFPLIRFGEVDNEYWEITPSTAAGQIRTVLQWGSNRWTSMKEAFAGCNSLTINATDVPDLSAVTDVSNMFAGADFTGDLSDWDVSGVKNMVGMFSSVLLDNGYEFDVISSSFTGDLSKWNVSSVTDMSSMFAGAEFTGDISQWDVSNVKNMAGMFAKADFNRDLSDWDVSSVTNMEEMFYTSPFNGSISEWDVSSVVDMSGMFSGSSFTGDISRWNVGSVTDMGAIFYESSFTGDISRWDVSSVTNMAYMFGGSDFTGDLSDWDISSVTNMSSMFFQSKFTGDISRWDVSSVTDMSGMFAGSAFNRDLSDWDIGSVTNMNNMFSGLYGVAPMDFIIGSSVSSENYDKLLIGWSTLNTASGETQIPSNITFGAPPSYSRAGKEARTKLISAPYNWIIKGDELLPLQAEASNLQVLP